MSDSSVVETREVRQEDGRLDVGHVVDDSDLGIYDVEVVDDAVIVMVAALVVALLLERESARFVLVQGTRRPRSSPLAGNSVGAVSCEEGAKEAAVFLLRPLTLAHSRWRRSLSLRSWLRRA